MLEDTVQTAAEAVERAKAFLGDRPEAAGPFRVSDEQDFWLVKCAANPDNPVLLFVWRDTGQTNFGTFDVVDVEIRRR